MDPLSIQARTGKYFDAWNGRDDAKLRELFADAVKLSDWELSVQGVEDVVKANQQIWKTFPNVHISIKNVFISVGESCTATCEVEVDLRDESSTILNVVDIIEFSPDAHITAFRAYKQ